MVSPEYAPTSNYVRIGPTILLLPDDEYFKEYPDVKEHVFAHHGLEPYFLLAEKYNH